MSLTQKGRRFFADVQRLWWLTLVKKADQTT